MADEKYGLNYISGLNLSRDPFAPEPNLTFYYEYESLENTNAMLNRLVQGDEIIILVIGESGSGKTSLLKRFLTASIAGWKTGRIRIQPESRSETGQQELFSEEEVDSFPAYFLQDIKDSIIIIDNAHELSKRQLTYVLKKSQLSSNTGNVKRFVLFGEPHLVESVNTLTESLSNEIAISKIFLPPMTREQTTGYLNYRLAVAGYIGKRLFSASTIKKIHRLSGGLPGRINSMADQQLKETFSEEKQRQNEFGGWIQKNQKALSWSAAGVVALIIVVLVGGLFTEKQNSASDNPGLSQRVFRSKIDLPVAFEKTQPPAVEIPLSENQTPDATQLQAQSGQVPANLSADEITIQIASKTPEPIAPQPRSTPEEASGTEKTTVTGNEPEKHNMAGKAVYREQWLLSQNSSSYTIQILGVHDERRLLNFIEKDLTATQTNLAYYQTRHKGKDWYRLLYGVYASQKEASSAMRQLPPHIQEASPWIRRMSSVHKAIQKQTKP